MKEIKNIVLSGEPFNIKVQTKSSIEGIFLDNGIIKVKVHEVPENGKANKAIIELFSKTFKISKGSIEIVRGLTSSNKLMRIVK